MAAKNRLALAAKALGLGAAAYSVASWLRGRPAMNLSGCLVLVTGAGSDGVGREVALGFARAGCRNIAIWDINATGLAETKRLVQSATSTPNCPVRVYADTVDLADGAAVQRAVRRLELRAGQTVAVLVNNAGVVSGSYLVDETWAQTRRIFDVNVIAHFSAIRAVLPAMIRRGEGHVVSVASMAAFFATPKMTSYAASKAAVVSLCEGLRRELATMVRAGKSGAGNVTVTCVCPSHITTKLFRGFKQPIVPSLSPRTVASAIVQSTRARQPLVLLPWLVQDVFLLLRALLPTAWADFLLRSSGVTSAMDSFDNRHAATMFHSQMALPVRSRL